METFVVVTDLCGREPAQCVPLSALDGRGELEEVMADWPDREEWFLGEISYRIATDAERDAAATD
jgi:hypothetical protein